MREPGRRAIVEHRAQRVADRRLSVHDPGDHRRPSVRLESAGAPLRGQPHPVRRLRHHDRRRRGIDEPGPDGFERRIARYAVPARADGALRPRAAGNLRRADGPEVRNHAAADGRVRRPKPRARIRAQAVVGTDPVLMLEGPIPGTAAVLKRAGLDLKSIDLFEVNEAFASVVLAWQKETGADMDKTNVNGGAIAVGHPLGASGAILMNRLLYELERRDLRYGLETMCCGGGLGTATIIDRVVE